MRIIHPQAVNPFFSLGVVCEACFPHFTGCPGIAVLPGVAHFPFIGDNFSDNNYINLMHCFNRSGECTCLYLNTFHMVNDDVVMVAQNIADIVNII